MARKALMALLGGLGTIFAATAASTGDHSRQADIVRLGAEVMPFDLKATTHIFTKTLDGGVQRVVAKNPRDAHQIVLVRMHLRELDEQFAKGNFTVPSSIHGNGMPGLAELQAAKPGAIRTAYSEIQSGAEIRYTTQIPAMVIVLHRWFDAQVSDHGPDAMAGHDHSSMHIH